MYILLFFFLKQESHYVFFYFLPFLRLMNPLIILTFSSFHVYLGMLVSS